ncbi:MAG TPA: 5-(carboxyamino)imidazole ribonucleotide synthase [Candidatus Saccharimonadales bacterium]|nr:5-(carboxyamino)imidazole ribonucleotide synthase [Candidatus Saccharimonadales bacterium]
MAENRIGIVGGGQLGRMLTEAAKPMGFEVTVLESGDNPPAVQAGARQIEGSIKDAEAIAELARQTDVLTWEIEHINVAALIALAEQGYDIQPSPETLKIIHDKLAQKTFLKNHGIPVAPFYEIDGEADLQAAITESGTGLIVKSRFGGFDGRGNLDLDVADWQSVTDQFEGQPIYAEKKVSFQKEVALIAARDKVGNVDAFPLVETMHQNGICDIVTMPVSGIPTETWFEATQLGTETTSYLQGAGVFAIEMFITDDGGVLVNEIAPRVHNSGHLTMEATRTSQFEQHVRAIAGLPLGSSEQISSAAMANILYGPVSLGGVKKVLSLPDVHLHLYGKQPRPDSPRKIGHITARASVPSAARSLAVKAREELTNG